MANTIETITTFNDPSSDSVAAAGLPLQSIQLTFHTNDDDKDGDTDVSVSVDNHSLAMGAGNVGGGQHWDDGSTNVAGLPVVNGVDYYDCLGQHMNITIRPNGNDTWNFNVTLHETFANGAWREVSWNGISLAEDRPSIDLNATWSS